MGIPGYDVVRLPRLGVIRLGEKKISQGGKPYPSALDHFNFKDAPAVEKVYGQNCKELDIMFPVEDPDKFFNQALRSYTKSNGLFCTSRDGENATRIRLGISTGEYTKVPKGQPFDPEGEAYLKSTGEDPDTGEMFELPCGFHECRFFEQKFCKPTARLLFLLPKVDGFGCWQITTTSWHGMVNLNSYIAAIRSAVGRVSMIPLKLKLQPQEVQADGKKKTVHVLVPVFEGNLTQLMAHTRRLPALPAPELPKLDPKDVPDDLMPHAGAALDEDLGTTPPPPKPQGDPAAAARARLGQPQPPPQPAPAPTFDPNEEGDAQEPVDFDGQNGASLPAATVKKQAPVAAVNGGAKKRPWG